MKRFLKTVQICYYVFMARQYGDYVHNVHNTDEEYAIWEWKGQNWCIPPVYMKPKV